MSPFFFTFPVIVTALVASSSPSVSAPERMTAFGHEISVIQTPDFDEELRIGDRVFLRDAYISLGEVGIVDGVGVVSGSSWLGGASCDWSVFIISFPPGEPPRFDGPVGNCRQLDTTWNADAITIANPAVAGFEREAWRWTPGDGFMASEVSLVGPAKSGWREFRRREATHPHDLRDYSEIEEMMRELIGRDAEEVYRMMSGPGVGEWSGDQFIGLSCQQHMCDETALLAIADVQRREVMLAWWTEANGVVQRPPAQAWSEDARWHFEAWLRDLQR